MMYIHHRPAGFALPAIARMRARRGGRGLTDCLLSIALPGDSGKAITHSHYVVGNSLHLDKNVNNAIPVARQGRLVLSCRRLPETQKRNLSLCSLCPSWQKDKADHFR
jgi:hypothetical protein